MKIGYMKVLKEKRNTIDRELLKEQLGVEVIIIDIVSYRNLDRFGLKEIFNNIRENDCLITESIDTFAMNIKELFELMDIFNSKKVQVIIKKEAIDTNTEEGKSMIKFLKSLEELEKGYLKFKQRQGIEIAKENGKYKGRQKIEIDEKEFKKVYDIWKSGDITATKAMQLLNIKANTFYRRVKEYESNNND